MELHRHPVARLPAAGALSAAAALSFIMVLAACTGGVAPDAGIPEGDAEIQPDAGVDAAPSVPPASSAAPLTAPVENLAAPASCSACHGDASSSAPPSDLDGMTATAERSVGAHRNHLRTSPWHHQVVCEDCHRVPRTVDDPGHIDTPLPAELTWSPLASARGAAPIFDGVTCADVYCHGSRLELGGVNTAPVWNVVDGSQSYCGTCHSLPPNAPHPQYDGCATCHPTVGAGGGITEAERHVDGLLDLEISELTCTSCHGTEMDANPAPPRDTANRTDTSERSVGAHRSHLGASDWHREVQCDDCHIVPHLAGAGVFAMGHIDTPRPAEITWGGIALARGATPEWNGVTCTGVYCHGATLTVGGTNIAPQWTTVDGTQAACGTCHEAPPGGAHPSIRACSACHPGMGPGLTFVDASLHINGVVDVDLGSASCTACHGSELDGTPAPPFDTSGNTETSARGVGAHRSHLGASDWHKEVVCADCHVVPAGVLDVGHFDTPLPAEVTFGALATTDATTPSFDGTTCAGVYCHGATLWPGGTSTTPTWTVVDGTEAACGTCHGLPPGGAGVPPMGAHPALAASMACVFCHQTMGEGLTITDPSHHIDGIVQLDYSQAGCTDCHTSF